MTTGVRALDRVLLGLLGAALLALAVLLGLDVAAGTDVVRGAVADLASAVDGSSSGTASTWVATAAALGVAVLAVGWLLARRRGRVRSAVVMPSPDGAPAGEVVLTAEAVERLVHGLVRAHPDALGASVTAVRQGRGPRYDVVVAPRRGADPGAVAGRVAAAAQRASAVLGVPVDPTVRLRASAVRRVRSSRRVT